jgi:hypothetical protein
MLYKSPYSVTGTNSGLLVQELSRLLPYPSTEGVPPTQPCEKQIGTRAARAIVNRQLKP